MEAGLMELGWFLNSSWIYDTYLNWYRAIHPAEKSGGGKMSGRELSGYHQRGCSWYTLMFDL